ncbi:hypothetical protein [Clostridium novyi]|uniref:hypothetical protein n=1 Tax=Clostridium novyi TaxID=1542 RepID=UPI0004DACECF|nr:hypothetical protein [Clostridium novyi]KEH89155.1 hypothetical protein Z967_11035 [Clostridium novyi A str. 4540]KEH95351.1 hypothetical protein Z964_08210 [Clostridium novyi A str. GD211209]
MHQIKNFLSFLLILILTTILSGCNKNNIISPGKIIPPENYDIAISGEWIIKKYYPTTSSGNSKNAEDKIGKIIYVDKDKLELLDKTCISPNFKIKIVDATSYLASNYGIAPSLLNIEQADIQVITVTNKDNYFTSFIKLNNNNLIATIDDNFFLLTKKSRITGENNNGKVNSNINFQNQNRFPKNLDCGLLLGLKSYVPCCTVYKKNSPKVIYRPVFRTIWVNFASQKVENIYEIHHLVYARKSGFWYLTTNYTSSNDYKNYKIATYPITKNNNPKLIESPIKNDIINIGNSYSIDDVLFVGDDYISLESTMGSLSENNSFYLDNSLRVEPIDTLNSDKDYSISISKLLGQQGLKSLKQGAATYVNSLDFNKRKDLNPDPDDKSFGVIRKNGKWVLKGRLYYFYENHIESSPKTHEDFDIPIIPPKELIGYDLLFPNWNIIKKKIPDALDAYSSPDKNFVVVLTNSKVLIYNIINNDLASSPIETLNLRKNEVAVMSQWATGSYVNTWDDQMKKIKH